MDPALHLPPHTHTQQPTETLPVAFRRRGEPASQKVHNLADCSSRQACTSRPQKQGGSAEPSPTGTWSQAFGTTVRDGGRRRASSGKTPRL